jgi:hypothetical protein
MKILLVSVLLLIATATFAGRQAPVPADTSHVQKYQYCVLQGLLKMMSVRETLSIDFGEAGLRGLDAATRLTIEEKVKSFSSKVDALNYLGGFGWEFVSGYSSAISSGMVQYWVLRKAKE